MKKREINIIIAVVAIIIIIIGLFTFSKLNKKGLNLEDSITSLGKDFYEKYYYDSLTSKDVLDNFTDTGISINLTTINTISPIDSKIDKNIKNKKCDYEKTKVLIYPKKPFNKKDYNIKVELTCEK